MAKVKPPLAEDLERWQQRTAPRRRSEVPGEIRTALSQGWIESRNLVEWLLVDRVALAKTLVREMGLPLSPDDRRHLDSLTSLSALKQSWGIGRWLVDRVRIGDENYLSMTRHASDVVREISAILVGVAPDLSFAKRLAWIKTQADDTNAGTRELAWMALRQYVIDDPEECIRRLVPWTGSRNERLRRFASEVTRPCGVWCLHIPRFKESPQLGLPLLDPLCADESRYVGNSVANWLNDASKTQPEWVRSVTTRWSQRSPCPETERIVRRALRTIGKDATKSPRAC